MPSSSNLSAIICERFAAIVLNYYKENVVCVDLKGACSGCPSSTSTLKGGIETLLKQKVNPNIEVIANER